MQHLGDLGYKIRILRQQRGLSQAALGRHLNVSQKEISHYENNYRRPPAEVLSGIARVLETSIADLYGEEAAPRNDTGLKKSTIWMIAERLEDLDEQQRREVLAFIERMADRNSRPGAGGK